MADIIVEYNVDDMIMNRVFVKKNHFVFLDFLRLNMLRNVCVIVFFMKNTKNLAFFMKYKQYCSRICHQYQNDFFNW